MSSITGLGLRNKVGIGSSDSSSRSKPEGSITGLGLRNKAGIGSKSSSSSSSSKPQGSSITGLGLRNKAAGLTGGGGHHDEPQRIARPMSTLKDPSLFGPPPKNVNYHNSSAEERQQSRIAQKGPLTPAEYQAREKEKYERQKEEEAREKEQRRIDREEKATARLAAQQRRLEEDGPQLPTRNNDTTGLSTSQFAPPVARRAAADGSVVIRPTAPPKVATRPPILPPRLPPRQDSVESGGISTQIPSPTQQRHLPTAIATGPLTSPESPALPPAIPPGKPQLNELQTRFAQMNTSSPSAEPPSQKWGSNSALRTASPLSNSSSEHVARSWKPVETPDQSYGVKSLHGHDSFHHGQEGGPIELKDNTSSPVKKAPPPRPKKKAELSGY